jgi:hypothetical protein
MRRTTAIGFVSAVALGVSLASPASAMSGRTSGGTMHSTGAGPGNTAAMRSNSSPGRMEQHDMGRMRVAGDYVRDKDHDRDRDRDHRDHDRFRFFPAFAFGVNTYDDVYDPTSGDCWEFHRVWTHAGWRLRRYWVCN